MITNRRGDAMPDFLAGLCDPDTLQMLAEGTLDTLYMTLASTFFAYVFGMIMAVVLVVCRADGIPARHCTRCWMWW